jgi:hypothetical protein
MSDYYQTPETDAALIDAQQYYKPLNIYRFVFKDVSTKLERERNLAIQKLAASRLEVARWKKAIIPFLTVHAAAYGRELYGDGCMHFGHYDMLKEAGARMDDFRRCGDNESEVMP